MSALRSQRQAHLCDFKGNLLFEDCLKNKTKETKTNTIQLSVLEILQSQSLRNTRRVTHDMEDFDTES